MTTRTTIACSLVLALALVPMATFGQNVDTGSADFSKYVALGDSLTAGFASGGLVETYQRVSYPALINERVKGPDTPFQQPLVSEPGIPPLLRLQSLAPLVIAPQQGQGNPLNLNLPRPYDNLAVPGARVGDVLEVRTDGLFKLVLRPQALPFSMLEQGLALNPTFVTLWIGSNDVLGAATSGIVIDGVTLTPRAAFAQDLQTVAGAIAQSGAGMAIATIADVTTIPFVNTIPPVVVDPATNQPVLVDGQPVPLIGPAGPLTADDKVLLSASQALAQGIGIPAALGGTGQPLDDTHVLNAAEISAVQARTRALNQVIRDVAQQTDAALVDVAAVFDLVAREGIEVGGIEYNTDFLTGGVFSYDGVHATQFGYAFVANLFIEAINEKFGATIPLVDLSDFVFGSDRQVPEGFTAAEAAQAMYTPEAHQQLWEVLRIPPKERLLELKRRRGERPEGPDLQGPDGRSPAPRQIGSIR